MKILSSVGLLVVAIAGLPGPAQGQGWYLGSELGAHVVPALGITGLSNDRASVCDEFINPQYAAVTQTAGYEAYNCTGLDRRDDWVNQFARATGLQTSWVLGYRFGADTSGPRWRHVRTEEGRSASGWAPFASGLAVAAPWAAQRPRPGVFHKTL